MDLDARRDALLARREELLAEIGRIADLLDDPKPADWDDAAIQSEDDEVLQAKGNSDRAELRRIDAALDRIETGAYGSCVRCGAEIPEKRLDLLPDTPFCAACA